MANGHGGARTPARPAPVSGPGAMSRRTDGGPGQPVRNPGGMDYGDNQAFVAQQQAAPMAGRSATASPGGLADLISVPTTPITAPTAYPTEPLTTGVAGGPGAGPEVLASAGAASQPTRRKLMADLPAMMRLADQPDASPELRALVRYLRTQVQA